MSCIVQYRELQYIILFGIIAYKTEEKRQSNKLKHVSLPKGMVQLLHLHCATPDCLDRRDGAERDTVVCV